MNMKKEKLTIISICIRIRANGTKSLFALTMYNIIDEKKKKYDTLAGVIEAKKRIQLRELFNFDAIRFDSIRFESSMENNLFPIIRLLTNSFLSLDSIRVAIQ